MERKVVIYEMCECELCGRDMNPNRDYIYFGRYICFKCEEDIRRISDDEVILHSSPRR